MSDNTQTFDALVVGGGFAGLSAALQLARARRSVLVIDAGSPRNRFARSSHGVFGHDGGRPLDMLATARGQVAAYPTARILTQEAVDACAFSKGFKIELASGETVAGRRVILATGVADVLPEVPGLKERWGRSVFHCPYCHGFEIGGGRVGVLGIGPASIHQALMLVDWGPATLFLNGTLQLSAEERARLDARGVAVEPAALAALEGELDRLTGARLADGRLVSIQAMFTGTKTVMASPIAARLGCAMDDGHFGPVIRTDAWKTTTTPGVYAAGDIAREPHNVTWATADGVSAGIGAHQSLMAEAVSA